MDAEILRYRSRLMRLAALFIGIMGAAACNTAASYHKNHAHATVRDADIARGEQLAVKYCQSCHMLPSPDLLDAVTWEKGVLPAMGPRLGIFEHLRQRYPESSQDPHVGRSFYPSQPLLSDADWGAIITYYTSVAPDSLVVPARGALRVETGRFRVRMPGGLGTGTGEAGAGLLRAAADARPREDRAGAGGEAKPGADASPPATCFIQYDSVLRQVLTSDILTHAFTRWSAGLTVVSSKAVPGAVVSMVRDDSGMLALNIGAFQPNNAPAGFIDRWIPAGTSASGSAASAASGLVSPGARTASPKPSATPIFHTVSEGLIRPVHMAEADVNADGRKDIVVCEFGYLKGALCWLENKGDGSYARHVIKELPGAIRVVVADENKDGLPDLWVLFAQGEEGVFLFLNKGGGQFAEREVLRFPPSYGSTYFELADIDGDGRKDILYSCGDNGDFSTVLKPYHGIYLFLRDSGIHFTQRYFFQLNGSYRAMAADLDRDGRADIIAMAYFADYAHHPDEGLVYLHHEQGLTFDARTVPGTELGRWITMDIADVNRDGWPDILLANCSVGPVFNKGSVDWQRGPALMVLENIGR